MHSFCIELDKLLFHPDYKKAKIYHYCNESYKKKANAAFLMGAYQVIYLKKSAADAWKPFTSEKFVSFRDALRSPCTYECTILHCLEGLEWAIKLKWYDPSTFDLAEYQFYEQVENGDLNWIIPKKFVAFSTPVDNAKAQDYAFGPEFYAAIFKKMGVKMVVRLNNKEYDREKFLKKGIKHLDLFFQDGSCPSMEKVNRFIDETEKESGAIAVHCKAGLGRTGTLISCYAMKNYKITARAMIGWIRICRPGSVLGPQQHFLCEKEAKMHDMGTKVPGIIELTKKLNKMTVSEEVGAMSAKDKEIAINGDAGQAEGLLGKKKGSALKKGS
eukprot:TRINITY_DN1433_c0_g1_i8.p1 TRINITY_DN1433_c0_g1~~TRINITY_DN1433_c0_g1_i8.p1  ORF type:complete len:329 (+),score=90.92 TRINITY_DN1433_c0_g1_i8:343-1329(+)